MPTIEDPADGCSKRLPPSGTQRNSHTGSALVTAPDRVKIGIIICDRYRTCAGGKCLRALRAREGAFSIYRDTQIDLIGYTACGGCPGGNVEYAPAEMKKNGAQVIHLATGMIVGYPPCPHLDEFRRFIRTKYQLEVVVGTHPIPEGYFRTHQELGTWAASSWKPLLEPTLVDRKTRLAYDSTL